MIALIMIGLLTWQSGHQWLPSVAVFVLQCFPTAESFIMVILVGILRGMNPDHLGSKGGQRRQYQEVQDNDEELENMEEEEDEETLPTSEETTQSFWTATASTV